MSPASQSHTIAPATGNDATTEQPAIDDLAFSLVAALRRHPHLGNELTHISRSNWPQVEQTLRAILDIKTQRHDLTPLARNILDLVCGQRDDTGRVFNPYFRYLLTALAGPHIASSLCGHIACLAPRSDELACEIPAARLADAAFATKAGVAIHA